MRFNLRTLIVLVLLMGPLALLVDRYYVNPYKYGGIVCCVLSVVGVAAPIASVIFLLKYAKNDSSRNADIVVPFVILAALATSVACFVLIGRIATRFA